MPNVNWSAPSHLINREKQNRRNQPENLESLRMQVNSMADQLRQKEISAASRGPYSSGYVLNPAYQKHPPRNAPQAISGRPTPGRGSLGYHQRMPVNPVNMFPRTSDMYPRSYHPLPQDFIPRSPPQLRRGRVWSKGRGPVSRRGMRFYPGTSYQPPKTPANANILTKDLNAGAAPFVPGSPYPSSTKPPRGELSNWDICWDFKKGNCKRESRCQWRHVIGIESLCDAKPPEDSSAKPDKVDAAETDNKQEKDNENEKPADEPEKKELVKTEAKRESVSAPLEPTSASENDEPEEVKSEEIPAE